MQASQESQTSSATPATQAAPAARSPRSTAGHDVGGDYLRAVKAQQVGPGDRFLTRQGEPSTPVAQVRTARDDFGTPALVVATLEDGREVRIAYGSTIRVRTRRPAPALDVSTDLHPAEEGSPEAVVVEVAQLHPDNQHVLSVASKLSRGINLRSGSQLEDIDTLAHHLFIDLDDSDGALRLTTLLTQLPYDGAMGRWKSIESALALAAAIHFYRGEEVEGRAAGNRLREPDEAESDPIRAQRTAEIRQRQLNEPNLYDREVLRAETAGDLAGEREWREARLATLMYLRARGGSETFTDEELDRRVRREVADLRALADRIAAAGDS